MDTVDWLFLAAAVVLLVSSGLYTAAEIGLLSVNRFRTVQRAEQGDARARLLQRLLQQPAAVLTAILITITALTYLNGVLVTYWLTTYRHAPDWAPAAGLLALVLLFAEFVPITYAAANPEVVATRLAPVIAATSALLRPIVAAATLVSHLVLRLLGGTPRTAPLGAEEEVLSLVNLEAERGRLEEEEKELIQSIFEFSDTIVREIMVPRLDIAAVADDTTIAAAIDLTADQHYSRLPVYQGSLDHIVGMVHAKDLLPYLLREETALLVREAMRPATFVPETKRVSELLREFRETQQTLAIVLDEYGGTAGLVTVEDLLEEIVGEIYDEYDVNEEPMVEWLGTQTVLVDGKLPLDTVIEVLGTELPRGEYDTVGGLLYSRFGDVPTRGEAVEVEGCLFTVERLDGHRITKVRIDLPTPEEGGPAS